MNKDKVETKTVTIEVDGVPVKVEAGTPFTVTTQLAREAGLRKVIIILNGHELGEDEDPAVLKDGDRVVVRRDDSSGS